MDTQRSPFDTNIVELLVAITTAFATWFGLHAILWSGQPWPGDYAANDSLPNWFLDGRVELFNNYVVPISIILALSALFLVRGIENQNIRYFSRSSHFALAWPLVLFALVTIFSFLSLYCFPVGLILSFISVGKSVKSGTWLGSVLAIAWNIVCIIVAFGYFASMWDLFGD